MKKLLLASGSLLLFTISILIIQASCSKSSAEPTTTNQLNKILWIKHFGSSSFVEFWTINYDGTNPIRIIPNFPANVSVYENTTNNSAALSPDGTKLFFRGQDTNLGIGLYSCDISGNNVTRLADLNSNDFISGAY